MKNWSLIVAIGKHNEIGKDNDLLWHLSDDLKRFKALTTGHTIIMGRKTFDSLPKGALPNRRNIVLSSQNLKLEHTEVYSSLDEIKKNIKSDEQVFIIGGASIYKMLIDKVEKIYLTQVHESFKADVFFPEINWSDWEVSRSIEVPKGEKNEYTHTYSELIRKQ